MAAPSRETQIEWTKAGILLLVFGANVLAWSRIDRGEVPERTPSPAPPMNPA